MTKLIEVEVVYAASPHQQALCKIAVLPKTSMGEAIIASGILSLFPEIDLAHAKIGVFSQPRELSDKIAPGQRIEIYRPLSMDPKEARRLRAKKK